VNDAPRPRAYRDFFCRVGVDPTKVRPAAEALLRRVIQGKPFPRINALVDGYNLASAETRIALAAFDIANLRGDLRMRRSRPGETFLGIGMRHPSPSRAWRSCARTRTGSSRSTRTATRTRAR